MIRRTFLILPTVGESTERSLWRKGIGTWDDFLSAGSISGFSRKRKRKLDSFVEEAARFMEKGQTQYFTRILPGGEHWRLFGDIEDKVAYLDIETDGLRSDSMVTVVGIHKAGRTRTLVHDQELTHQNLSSELSNCKMLVTFNGGSFDLPILQYHFPFAIPLVPHLDLRHACKRIGLTGGLKQVERSIGIRRAREVEYVTGEQAVYLWKLWTERGKRNALTLLRRYNEEDTRNLETVARHACNILERRVLGGSR
ncbi:MAG: ribonuclease H-like domain-containing protein [Methanomassiliicoccales archaeon]|nr:ribonuclease H-like domain-containing protein [Methanomassiliicoccales archaeon]